MENIRRHTIFWILATAAAAYGFWYAWHIRWTCDDIYITLRYIDHWFKGEGLVYNAGEHVEGYTHFLWLLLVAGAGRLGADMMDASVWLGLFSFPGLILLSARRAQRIGLSVPVAALYLCVHHDMGVWATGGLETMFYALLVFAAFYVRFQSRLPYPRKLWAAGLLCALSILTRPDAALLLAWFFIQETALCLWWRTPFRETVKSLFLLGIFPLLLLTPWLVWKWEFYGSLLPNTYYAKSGGLSYFSQGWIYLDSYARAYVSVYAAAALGLAGIVAGFRKRAGGGSPAEVPLHAQSLSVLLFVVLYAVVFIAKSGGDYMYARFMIPVAALCLIPAENALAAWTAAPKPAWRYAAVWILALCWAAFGFVELGFRNSLFRDPVTGNMGGKWKMKIYDSHTHHKDAYPSEKYRRIGEEMRPVFAGTKARVLNFGDCCLCYYAGFDYVLENFGLTDTYIAHKPLLTRETMVGHEKYAEREYMDRRQVQLCFNGPDFSGREFTKITFISSAGDTVRGDILRYDLPLMQAVAANGGSGIRFTDARVWFDSLLADREAAGKDSLRHAYESNLSYYFEPNRHLEAVRRQEERINGFIR